MVDCSFTNYKSKGSNPDATLKKNRKNRAYIIFSQKMHIAASFDIESLFTNIPLAETINICVEKRSENKTKVNNLTIESFRALLELTPLESFFILDEKYY